MLHNETVRVWEADSGRELLNLSVAVGGIGAATFSPDSSRVYSTTLVWNQSGYAEVTVHENTIATTGGKSGSEAADAIVQHPASKLGEQMGLAPGNKVITFKHPGFTEFSLSMDNSRFVTASDVTSEGASYTSQVLDAVSGEVLVTLPGIISHAEFSPDSTSIVSVGSDGAKLWDAHSGQELLTLATDDNYVYFASFSTNGSEIVTACVDGTATVWNTQTGQKRLTLHGHSGAVLHAAFNPDGTRVVTASIDQTAKLWDAHSGEELLSIGGFSGDIVRASFSPDGTRLLVASLRRMVVFDSASWTGEFP